MNNNSPQDGEDVAQVINEDNCLSIAHARIIAKVQLRSLFCQSVRCSADRRRR